MYLFEYCLCGLMSQSLYDFRRKYDLDYINKGDHVYMSKHQIVNKARISISKFFGSKINQTFVSSNFSSALRSVLEYVPKTKLLILEDYPSILNALKERSFNYHKIPITIDLEHNIEKLIEEKKLV